MSSPHGSRESRRLEPVQDKCKLSPNPLPRALGP